MRGQVVRAQHGNRHLYQPIRSQLCDSSDPVCVAEALLRLYPFKSLYIADLDAIQGSGDNLAVVMALRARLGAVEIWLDAGFTRPVQIADAAQRGLRCVIASERLQSPAHYAELISQIEQSAPILSLDFGQEGFRGPAPLANSPECWPEHLICMTLGRVGSYAGPDFEQLQQLLAQAQGKRVYAAGGVRDAADLEQLARSGSHGALVASALHDRKLLPEQLARWMAHP